LIVDDAGFNAAFPFLAGVAALAFLLFWLAMRETRGSAGSSGQICPETEAGSS
jgi:hypothetical protein